MLPRIPNSLPGPVLFAEIDLCALIRPSIRAVINEMPNIPRHRRPMQPLPAAVGTSFPGPLGVELIRSEEDPDHGLDAFMPDWLDPQELLETMLFLRRLNRNLRERYSEECRPRSEAAFRRWHMQQPWVDEGGWPPDPRPPCSDGTL
jgi:hypothetical protein